MRADAFGLFWEDAPPEKKTGTKSTYVRPLAAIPDNGWQPPGTFPNLSAARVLGLDTETNDLHLKTHGPGWARNDGEVVGISLATEDGYKWYFPIRHTVQTELNLDPERVFAYLSDTLRTDVPKVGANLYYDVGWLQHEGVSVKGPLYDVAYAEAILFDTARDYSLNAIAERWLGLKKTEDQLYSWCAKSYGGNPDRKQAGNIYRAPPSVVGPYAEDDALLPLQIIKKQWKALQDQGLLPVFLLECKLIPVLVGMRYRGLPVSVERAEKARDYLRKKEEAAQDALNSDAGFELNVYSSDDLQRLFEAKKLAYPRTKKGAPSFRKDWLAAHTHPAAALVNDVRKYAKARGTFIENAILDKHVDGILYPSFHPLRGEDGGAVSGRYSSSTPNAQQIPARDPELGPLIRGCFVPAKGYSQWIKQDLSQIEYRLFAHFSGDSRLIAEYQHKDTDYHKVVSAFLGHLMPRKTVKNFNFTSLYGGGKGRVVAMLKSEFTKGQAERLVLDLVGELKRADIVSQLADIFIALYDTNFPAARESLERDLAIAERTGEIRTILGRRSSFDLWEPIRGRGKKALPFDAARAEYGPGIRRAFCFRGLNRRLQGSSADLLKQGMLNAYEEGVFDTIGFPHVTVHDELDNSYHPDLREGFADLRRCIETAIPLKVPVLLGTEIGPSWGEVVESDLE